MSSLLRKNHNFYIFLLLIITGVLLFVIGNLLGKTDKEGQISEIELVQNFIDTQIKKAESEREKNEKLYRTLGTVMGVAIAIVLL